MILSIFVQYNVKFCYSDCFLRRLQKYIKITLSLYDE